MGCVLAFSIALNASGQTNGPVIQTPIVRADDYRTVLLRWNTETGAVYQVESADALEAEGAQGLKWVIRESDCVSKGTNSEWMDVGDARWLPRVLHPIFQEHRFYRVQKVNQATNTPPVVSVQLSQSNTASGFLRATALVSVADTNQSLYSVGIFVDGQRLGSMESFPSTNSGVWINSTEWPNGPHEIYAVATIADSAETTPANESEAAETNAVVYAVGVSPSQFVTFSNYISQFFVAIPYFQAGQTQEIVAKFEQDSYWRVSVLNYLDIAVRQFEGQGSSCYAPWDGNDDNGDPLPYGFYDYFIEARPSQYGPLSMARSASRSTMSMTAFTRASSKDDPAEIYKRTPAAMQFSRTNCDIVESIVIPSLNPAPPLEEDALKLSIKPERVITYTVSKDGTTNEFINGVPAFLYPPEPPPFDEERLNIMSRNSPQTMDSETEWPDDTYITYYPNRIPGNLFFGFAGTVGIGYQGHHPSSPPFGNPPGGRISTTQPPWGKITSASKLATGFSTDMGLAGWRTSFLKGDDNFNSLDLDPVLGPYSGTSTFATKCNFGLVIGHMTASAYNDPNYYATVPYVAIYNSTQPGAYQWIALPGMDLGNGNFNSKLRWMAFYGCNALKERDYSDLWTKFLLPMPPNLRLILGSEEGVFIDPRFGPLFADNLNGWTTQDGSPMTIFAAWCDAAAYAFAKESEKWWKHNFLYNAIGTRHMTAVYRDTTQGASWNTINDSIWHWGTDISFDWFDVSFTKVQVYSE